MTRSFNYGGRLPAIDAIGEAFCETDNRKLDDLQVNADFDAATTA